MVLWEVSSEILRSGEFSIELNFTKVDLNIDNFIKTVNALREFVWFCIRCKDTKIRVSDAAVSFARTTMCATRLMKG
jgi:hypothetical protein